MMVGLWWLAKGLVLVMVPLLGLALEMVPVCCVLVVRRHLHLHLHLHLVHYYLLPVPPAAVMPCSETAVAAVGVVVNEDWYKGRLSLLIFMGYFLSKKCSYLCIRGTVICNLRSHWMRIFVRF